MKTVLKLFFLLVAVLLMFSLKAQEADFVPGELLIKLKPTSKSKKTSLSSQMRAVTRKNFPVLGIELWEISNIKSKQETLELIDNYKNNPDIEFVEPNYLWEAVGGTIPNDPFFEQLWALNNTGQNGGTIDADIDATEAYCIETTYKDVVVGIVDTGIDYTHEDLAENIWQNLGEDTDGDGVLVFENGKWMLDPDDENGVDDDGNGYIDDFVGWDFAYNDNDPIDKDLHGTHCAGTVGAIINNNTGINGVAPNAKLAALKFLDDYGFGSTDKAVEAINYAVAMGMPITNNSWGGGRLSEALYNAIENAKANNHLFIAAAGNNGLDNNQYNAYPSSYSSENIISVAATNRKDTLWPKSNYGATAVDIAAPGTEIFSCAPGNGYIYQNGTSMATPHVTGVCAAMLGAFPNSNFNTVKDALMNSVDAIPALEGKCLSGGRVNMHNALVEMGTSPHTCNDEDITQPGPECDPTIDSLALVALYNATDGLNWENTWNIQNEPVTGWYGVSLNNEGCVTELNLRNNRLKGQIPAEISGLKHIENLNLSINQLNGPIPIEITQLYNLSILNLHRNKLSGVIPTQTQNLINLEELNFSVNNLSGNIPIELSQLTKLTSLVLNNNKLTGEIPSELGNLDKLIYLSVSSNQLTGKIPIELENLANIENLLLSGNQLIGTIPIQLASLKKLSILHLSDNLLTGAIPTWLGTLSQLSNVFLNDNQLTGNIPPELGSLSRLSAFRIHNNNLNGCYPESIGELQICRTTNPNSFISDGNNFDATWEDFCATGAGACSLAPGECDPLIDSLALLALYNETDGLNWTNTWDLEQPMSTWHGVTLTDEGCVKHLQLAWNQLNGQIPPQIGNIRHLERLVLAYSQYLNGPIPVEIGQLKRLEVLHLNGNSLDGSIPSQLNNLKNLTELDLASNNLNGNIPIELTELTNLTKLYLFKNYLTGEIHSEFSELVNLVYFEISDNLLSGNIPKEFGNFPNLRTLGLSENQLDGVIPVELANLPRIDFLLLDQNLLTGEIPPELGNLRTLDRIDLFENQLTGSIPPEFKNLTGLAYLEIFNNNLSGCYPKGLDLLQMCTYSGNNRVSEGNNFDANWEDYCATGAGKCLTQVWPGDFNNNGIVELDDMLYWGIAHSSTGQARPAATSNWLGQNCEDWIGEVNGVNNKYQDANGDGTINNEDLPILLENFGQTHNSLPINSTNSDIQFNLIPDFELNAVSNVTNALVYDFYLKNGEDTVSAHGVSASIFLGNLNVDDAYIETSQSSLGTSNTLYKFDNNRNTLSFALTKTDGINSNINDSSVCRVVVLVIEAEQDDTYALSVKPGSVMQADGSMLKVQGVTIYDMLTENSVSSDPIILNASTINATCQTGGSASVNANGGTGNYSYEWNTGETTPAITGLSPGLYSVLVGDDAGTSNKIEIEILGQFVPNYNENGELITCNNSFITCPTVVDFENFVPSNSVYQAARSISINADVSNIPGVVIKAGNVITLGNGFFTDSLGLEIMVDQNCE